MLGADPRLAQEILTQAAELLRGPLGRALGIRHSPELRFVQDELIESGARLSALINEAVKKDVATTSTMPEPTASVRQRRRSLRLGQRSERRRGRAMPSRAEALTDPPMRRFHREVDGILLLDKALGVSSNAALQQVRVLYAALKAGHAGSLDPLASGLAAGMFRTGDQGLRPAAELRKDVPRAGAARRAHAVGRR